MYNKFLSHLLKAIRKKENLTQKEMAKILDKSEISIRKYESGSYTVPEIIFFILFVRFKYSFATFLELINTIEEDYHYSVVLDDIKKFNVELEKYNIKLEKIDEFEIEKLDNITSFDIELMKFLGIYFVENKIITSDEIEIKTDIEKRTVYKNFLLDRIAFFKMLDILKKNLVNDFKNIIELIEKPR